MSALLTIDEALEAVLERASALPAETVALGEAVGRILSRAGVARVDLPPFPSSAMDGFAVRADETPGTLPVAFRVPAGTPAAGDLPPVAAAAVATGAVVPDGADTVVPVEQVVERGETVEIPEALSPGTHVRPRGGDVVAGTVLVDRGARLGARHIGALGAAGVAEVECARRPSVAVIATGSELRSPGEELGAGQIFESNRAMVAALLETTGAVVEQLPIVRDDERAHRLALEQGLRADLLVSSGGVSVGPHDLVRRVAAELGVEEVFWGVAVKPGKPLSFGVRGHTLVFGLPGNPVSALVSCALFVCPALFALQGASDPGPWYEPGRTTTDLERNGERDEFVRASRAWETDAVTLTPVEGQESHMIVRASSADALVHVPRGPGRVPAGAAVRYLALG